MVYGVMNPSSSCCYASWVPAEGLGALLTNLLSGMTLMACRGGPGIVWHAEQEVASLNSLQSSS